MRKKHSDEFKFRVSLAAIKGDLTIVELSQKYEISASLVHKWKQRLLASGAEAFKKDKKASIKEQTKDRKISKLYEKIGQLTIERDFLKKSWEDYEDRSD